MFLHEVGSTDPRFKDVDLAAGLNLVVADRDSASDLGDSRNGTGKSSLVRILRYLLGGNLSDDLKAADLREHVFRATLELPGPDGRVEVCRVERATTRTTRLQVNGWSWIGSDAIEIHVDEWREALRERVFNVPSELNRPTPGQLWGQLIRTNFVDPVKVFPTDTTWETGLRLGFMLGLAPEVLIQAGDVALLDRQRKAVRTAVAEGVFSHVGLDEGEIRASLASARSRRDATRSSLQGFQVEPQYREHQARADSLSSRIQRINDQVLLDTRRIRDIEASIAEEAVPVEQADSLERLTRLYLEVGVVLPESVTRRFDEVEAFHESVRRNRRTFLEAELASARERLAAGEILRGELDAERSEALRILRGTVALDTYLDAQASLALLEGEIADLERRQESLATVQNMDANVKRRTVEVEAVVHQELDERVAALDESISLFAQLGAEIYTDRTARLLVSTSSRGVLKVEPQVDGDASDGIRGVETFLLDMVSMVAGRKHGRLPGLLVHDSHLFDAIDHRQVASCLNIGARLADEWGFQYLVTMNSDFLSSVESEGAFTRDPYLTKVELTDGGDDGGLFGFKFA